jgi:hypothetical protein
MAALKGHWSDSPSGNEFHSRKRATVNVDAKASCYLLSSWFCCAND